MGIFKDAARLLAAKATRAELDVAVCQMQIRQHNAEVDALIAKKNEPEDESPTAVDTHPSGQYL